MEESREGVGVTTDSFAGEGPLSLISGTAETVNGSTESRLAAGGSSVLAKSGSVMHGPLRKGVEDSRCSLLVCMMPSLPGAVTGVVDKDGTL